MPLRDHFRPPLGEREHWDGFHNAWANTLVRHLNGALLPERYQAVPQITVGARVEVDVATLEDMSEGGTASAGGNGVATAVWAPARPTQSVTVTFPAQDVFEVRVYDKGAGRKLVAAVELVSPRNKDRPEARRAFAVKCASYLQGRVGLVVVDVVTTRQHGLFRETAEVLGLAGVISAQESPLYAVACRTTKPSDEWRMDTWVEGLTPGTALPTLPLWLASNLAVPLDLEASYEETRRVLRMR